MPTIMLWQCDCTWFADGANRGSFRCNSLRLPEHACRTDATTALSPTYCAWEGNAIRAHGPTTLLPNLTRPVMRPTRCFTCWACTAIVVVCLLQAAVFTGVFKTSSARLVSRTESGSVIESLSLSLTYSRWWGRPDVKAWDPPRPAKPSIPRDEVARLKDRCSEAVDIPKVALLFLTKGDLPHKDMWTMWLRSAAGQLPTNVRYNSFLQPPVVESGDSTAAELQVGTPAANDTVHNATKGMPSNTSSAQPLDGANHTVAMQPNSTGDASRGRSLLGALRVATRRRLLEDDTPAPASLTVDDGVELLTNAELQQLTETVAMCQVRSIICSAYACCHTSPDSNTWTPRRMWWCSSICFQSTCTPHPTTRCRRIPCLLRR